MALVVLFIEHDIANPKLAEFTLEGATVPLPHVSFDAPYVIVQAVDDHRLTVSALLLPDIDPPIRVFTV